jgi:Ca-activated chloride channel family protein
MKRLLIACTTAVAVVISATAIALACRVVPDKPHEGRPIPTLLHKEFRVDVKVKDQVAEVVVQPTFHNPHDWQVQGTYFLSLPAGAQVKDFSMIVGGKEVKAELLDSAKARQVYNNLVRTNADPAILELVGSQMLRADVSPVAAKGEVAIKVSYTVLLENQGGLVSMDIPFTNQFGGDYAVPKIAVNIDLSSKTALKNIYSPTHSVDVVKKDDRNSKVSYEAANYNPRKAFKLFYQLSDDEVGLTLLTHREAGQDGFFMLMASPKVEIEKERILPKDVVFVMDRSGSMAGEKIRQAREALTQALGSLNPKDRFNIVDFSSEATQFDRELVEATPENRARANRYIEGIKAAGSTNISEALEMAFASIQRDPIRVPMILFATDGLPTVGEQNMEKILEKARAKNPQAPDQTRVFVFGVGNDVNTQFLDKLADEHRGARDYVAPEEKIEAKVSLLMEKISNPVLGNLTLDLGSVKINDLYPRRLPDLFKGTQLVVFGRFEGQGPTQLTLKGHAAGQERLFRFDIAMPERDERHDFIPRLWAARKVAYLVDQIRLGGQQDKEVIEEIVTLGKKYGIVTPYTSFLITEDGKHAADPGKGGGGAANEEFNALKDKAARSGKEPAPAGKPADAQGASKDLKEGRETAGAEDLERKLDETVKKLEKQGGRMADRARKAGVKVVGNKTFFARNGIWTDTEFDADKMKDVLRAKFMSDEYFKILEEKPDLSKFFALGDAVIVVWQSKVYEVTPMEQK